MIYLVCVLFQKYLQTFAMSSIFWKYDENGAPSLLRDGEFLSFVEEEQLPLVRVARSQSDLFTTSTPPFSASAPVSFLEKRETLSSEVIEKLVTGSKEEALARAGTKYVPEKSKLPTGAIVWFLTERN